MIESFNILTRQQADKLISLRDGETKLVENALFLTNGDLLETQLEELTAAKFVLFGINDDIGVQANRGKPGAKNTWNFALKSLLNTQQNQFNDASKLLILGNFEFPSLYENLKEDLSDPSILADYRKSVEYIDKQVTQLMYAIKRTGKTPIVIGGGHNNAYGTIKGTSQALNSKINAINLDAHADLRALEGRHSGNGFSYTLEEGYLDRYYMLGLQENYNSEFIWNKIQASEKLEYSSFEAIKVRQETTFEVECKRGLEFVAVGSFGIELDCDAIESIFSSAATPSGFSVSETRRFIHMCASHKNAQYIHICEASTYDEEKMASEQTGKLLAFFITDFVKAQN